MTKLKVKDGFEGQQLINVPNKVLTELSKTYGPLFQFYITQIGYFPKARYHFRERSKGCRDNILIYCIQGKGHYWIDGKSFEVASHQYFILPATNRPMRYGADIDDPWTIYWVHFTGAHIKELNLVLGINMNSGPVKIPFNAMTIDLWHSMFESLESGYQQENIFHANFFLYSFIASFLYPLKPVKQLKPAITGAISMALNFMRSNVEKRITIDDMAGKLKISNSHFSTTFRKATGMAPMEYFIHLKMQKACELLNQAGMTIKGIALFLDYEDPYYFSRIFKKFVGTSPEKYRESAKLDPFKSMESR